MRPIFQAELVNGPFGDPGLLIDLEFERRALLFDLGDLAPLSTRKLLRIGDVFVSHAHMDHFGGFDRLLRVRLGRGSGVRLYGPPGFVDQVGHKLAAYTWNLVEHYATDFVIDVAELDRDGSLRRARFSSRARFEREPLEDAAAPDGLLLDEPQFRVRSAFLDHGTACLAFRFEEGVHVSVWKNRLEELGLPTGPWLTRLRRLLRAGAADDTPVEVRWRDRGGERCRVFPLAELRERIVELRPGQALCYVTDAAGTDANATRIVGFARGAHALYIEAAFLEQDASHALRKQHLTARLAGEIAHRAGVAVAVPFHFSPRYLEREAALREEFERAFRGAGSPS